MVSLRSGPGSWTLRVPSRGYIWSLAREHWRPGRRTTDVVVNAAGAWAVQIAALAGAGRARGATIAADSNSHRRHGGMRLLARAGSTTLRRSTISPWDDLGSANLEIVAGRLPHVMKLCDASVRPQDIQRGLDAMSAAMTHWQRNGWQAHGPVIADSCRTRTR